MTTVRVFPRRTSYTPTDPYAFVGEPPMWLPGDIDEVLVSCTFSWDRLEAERITAAWRERTGMGTLSGPAYAQYPCSQHPYFEAGKFVKQGVTFTTRGCPRQCPWCLVPEMEGPLRTLPIVPGWIVQDNNLLAGPIAHITQVFRMLKAQNRRITFAGGLDTRFLDRIIAEEVEELPIKEMFLACETDHALEPLREAISLLPFLKRNQLRCYVLCGFGDDTPARAEKRLEAVWSAGCLPYAQLWQPAADRRINYSPEWRRLARLWSRPAIMKARMMDNDRSL